MDRSEKIKQFLAILLVKVKEENPDYFNYAIPNLFSKKLGSLMLIREDILFSKSAIEKLINLKNVAIDSHQELSDEIIKSSLWYSTIIQYGHCYTENIGGHSRLEIKDVFNLPEDQSIKDIHDEIMELRHSFVAHRDDTEHEQAVVVMQIPKNDESADKVKFKIKAAKTYSPPIEKLDRYIELFDFILPKVEDKIQKQANKTRDSLFKNLDAKEISLLLIG